jgi:hypothetical protein
MEQLVYVHKGQQQQQPSVIIIAARHSLDLIFLPFFLNLMMME